MPVSQAKVATTAASRYLQHLCKHWSHKFEVEFTAEHGRVPFDGERVCMLEAHPDHLTLRVEAQDEATLIRLERVVIEHLKRFAFREDLGEVQWSRAG